MGEITGRQYMISALKRQYMDRLPTTVLVGPYCSRLTDYTVKDILKDPAKSAEAHLAFFERYQPDSIIAYNDVYLEAEAVGCELDFPEDDISHLKAPPILEDYAQLNKLKIPDPGKDGRLPDYIELCQRVSEKIRKSAALGLGQAGPWNLANHLRGTENLLIETATEPESVHELMKFTTEVVRTFGDALIEAGFLPSLGEACASCNLISPQLYHDFIKPYHKELRDYFKTKGAPMAIHICGYIDPIMEDLVETGINFISLDAPSSLEKLLDLAGGKIAIMGNVPTSLYASGTREEMEAAVDKCIETAAEGSGYILASGCEIPLNSTEDRITHFFNYAHDAGRSFLSRLREEKPALFEAGQ